MHKGEIDIITLGCSKNLVDAERLMRHLELSGWRCRHDAPRPQGEIAIINTCGFIGDAKEESINTILQFALRKTKGQLRKLYVMGCLSQRYRDELPQEIQEVDAWFGKFDYMNLLELLEAEDKPRISRGCAPFERVLTTPKHYTYLKISEGCNRHCSYCAIPLITGRHTSRPMQEILNEAKWLVSQGVKEINVIAQDLSSYGLDSQKQHGLANLIDQMAQINGIQWIRLHYAYPADFPYELLPVMAKHPNVCKYLDIALQHTTDHMLQLMRRHITSQEQDELIARIRREVPGICIRTTLMVGHPGETEEDFAALCSWVKRMRFDKMGAFAYSDEEGTFASSHYHDTITDEVKQARLDQLMAIQQEVSNELLQKKVGTIQRVMIDRKEGDLYIGRTEYDSPEVDCEVLVSSQKRLRCGEMINARITHTEDFDLYALNTQE